MANSSGPGLLIIERILRDRDSVWRQIVEERGLRDLTVQMLASSALSLALYGAVLGASHGPAQALSSAIKLPLLFLATLAICLPTLYLFNLVFGARLSVMQAVALVMVSITVTAALALAFAPISLFFLISAHSYWFFKLLNVAILVLAAAVGLRFLTSGMAVLNEHQVASADRDQMPVEVPFAVEPVEEQPTPALVGASVDPNGSGATAPAGTLARASAVEVAPQAAVRRPAATVGLAASSPTRRAQRPTGMTLLYVWIALFGFVGTQLAWTLRPFFGSPNEPFAVFRQIEGTFYSDIFATIGRLFGG